MAEIHYTATITDASRAQVHRVIDGTGEGWRIEFKPPRRNLVLNDLMWAKLTDISEQVIWYGERLTPENWKDVLTASLRNCRVVPTIDGDGLVPLGLRTSTMGDEEFHLLLDLIDYFAAQQGVIYSAPKWLEARAAEQRTAKRAKKAE
jgi:uncharacterized protein (UPF0248 family)